MMIHRHPTFFPLVLALLTLGLLGFMAYSLSGRPRPVASQEEVVVPVTEQDYHDAAQDILSPFLASYDTLPSDEARRAAIETASTNLLALSVPGSYKDLHLGLVTSLFLMRDGLYGNAEAGVQGRERLDALLADNPWLR